MAGKVNIVDVIKGAVITAAAVFVGTLVGGPVGGVTAGQAALTAFVASVVIGTAAQLLTKVPGAVDSFGGGESAQASSMSANGRMITIRQAAAPRQIIIGERRVGGIMTFAFLQQDRKMFHQVITFAGHASQELVDLYLNDEIAALDADGNVVSGSFYKTKDIPEKHSFTVPGAPYQITLPHTPTKIVSVTQHIAAYRQVFASETFTVPGAPYVVTLAHPLSKLESLTQTVSGSQVPVGVQFYTYAKDSRDVTFTANGVGAQVTINYSYDGEELSGEDFHVLASHYSQSGATFTFTASGVGAEVTINYERDGSQSYVKAKVSLGDEGTVQPFPALVTASGGAWSNDHLQAGCTKLWLQFDLSDPKVFPSGLPNVSALIKGAKFYDPRTDTTKWTHSPALAASGYLTASYGFRAVYATEINAAALTAAADECEERVRVKLGTQGVSVDASTNRITIRSDANGSRRVPLTGDGVRMSSSGTLPAPLAADTTYYAIRSPGSTVRLATTYANAIAGTAIDLTDAGSGSHSVSYWDEPRYTANGAFLLSEKRIDVLRRLKDAMAGKIVNAGGQWHIHAGAYEAPTITLTTSDIAGPIEVLPMVENSDNANGVRGLFTNPNAGWQSDDFPPLQSATYLGQDNDVEQWRDIDLRPFTCSQSMAQRLAKIDLHRLRNSVMYSVPCKLTALRALTGRTIAWTFSRYGWSAQVFEIDESAFYVDGEGRLGVNLLQRLTAASVYAWDETTEEQTFRTIQTTNIAPGQVATPSPVVQPESPGLPSFVEEKYVSSSGMAASRAIVSWPASRSINVIRHALEYKTVTESNFRRVVAERDPSDGISSVTLSEFPHGLYLMRTVAVNNQDVESDPSETVVLAARGLSDTPSDVGDFNLTSRPGGFCELSWATPSDLDVLFGGRTIVRFSPNTSPIPGWNDCVQIADVPGGQATITVAHASGTYRAKHRDVENLESASSVFIVTTEPDLLSFNAIQTITCEPSWTGQHQNNVVRSNKLQLGCQTLIDDMTDNIDVWPLIDEWGGTAEEGITEFTEIVDLAAVYTSRVTAAVETLSFDTDDTIDSWLENIDDWGLIDGPEISTTSCEIFISTTENDPNSASPIWSSWKPFLLGDYKARGMKFRVRLRSTNREHNIQVESLVITVDMPDRDQAVDFTTSAAGDTTVSWTLSPAFKTTPKLGVTMKNMATGDYLEVTNESATGFTANTRNTAGARVARNGTARGKAY